MYFLDFENTLFDSQNGKLYADTTELLRSLGNEAIVISRGDTKQEENIRGILQDVVRVTVLTTGTKTKAEYLANWPGYYGQEAVLVDDNPDELSALSEAFANLKLFEMRRNGVKGDNRFTQVYSLSELP